MRKHAAAIILTCTIIGSLTACGGSAAETSAETTTQTETKAEATETTAVEETTEAVAAFEPMTVEFANCTVEILGADSYETNNAEEGILVYYRYTNKIALPISPKIKQNITQGGTELQEGHPDGKNGKEWIKAYQLLNRKIQPEVSAITLFAVACDLESGPIQCEFGPMNSDESEKITIDPKNLPGVPEEELFLPIENPTWVDGLSSEAEMPKAHVKILEANAAEATEDAAVQKMIRVSYELTNTTEEEQSASMLTGAGNVYQDGISLAPAYNADYVHIDTDDIGKIAPGATAQWSMVYELRTESPIEVEVGQGNVPAVAGAKFDIK